MDDLVTGGRAPPPLGAASVNDLLLTWNKEAEARDNMIYDEANFLRRSTSPLQAAEAVYRRYGHSLANSAEERDAQFAPRR